MYFILLGGGDGREVRAILFRQHDSARFSDLGGEVVHLPPLTAKEPVMTDFGFFLD